MDNLDYGDFDKFLVFAGLALLLGAVTIPWVFAFQLGAFDFPAQDLNTLPLAAQQIEKHRLFITLAIGRAFPDVSGAMPILSLTCLVVGLSRWATRQRQLDKKFNLEIAKLSKEVEAMSLADIEAEAAVEAIETVDPSSKAIRDVKLVQSTLSRVLPHATHAQREISRAAKRYLDVEKKLTRLISDSFREDFESLPNVRVGKAQFDLVMRARGTGGQDLLCEQKYLRKGFKYSWLRATALRLVLSTDLYQQQSRRNAKPVLIIITSNEVSKKTPFQHYTRLVSEELSRLGAELVVRLTTESGLPRMSPNDARGLLLDQMAPSRAT